MDQEDGLSPSNQEGDVLHIPGCSADVCCMGKRATESSEAKTESPQDERAKLHGASPSRENSLYLLF